MFTPPVTVSRRSESAYPQSWTRLLSFHNMLLHSVACCVSNGTSLVLPLVCTRHALKEERHPLRRREREKHRLVVFTPRASHIRRARQRGIRTHVLDDCCRLGCRVMNRVTVHAVVVGVNLVIAVAASVDKLLELAILLGVQQVVAVGTEAQFHRPRSPCQLPDRCVSSAGKSATILRAGHVLPGFRYWFRALFCCVELEVVQSVT
mmetsp:Transcript_45961/g.73555  ORF Transcript_45961/g.73555 Transcript_45961/m.73555 type:complete len:206 (-) Transcript_45961:3904-4521(-)